VKVAIVHEWLVTLGGSELVLRELLRLYPDAALFTLIDRMPADDRAFLGVRRERRRTSLLNPLPGVGRYYRSLLPVFPSAVRGFDLRGYDVVISNSHSVANGVRTGAGQLHLSYCLSPMRYAWDLRSQYLSELGLAKSVRGAAANAVLDRLQRWDRRASARVGSFATLSRFIGERIERAYGRQATVIYPPVDTDFFTPRAEDSQQPAGMPAGGYYLTASRLVPYKRVDMIVRAVRSQPDRRLVVVGDGPDVAKVRAAAAGSSNVTLEGRVTRERLRDLLRGARAFLFAAEEDFGIAPVEAQACGVPVVAYGRGGAVETVNGMDAAEPTGVLFGEQSERGLADAIGVFESNAGRISPAACRANAERFSEARFRREFAGWVEREWRAFAERESQPPS
jgi:glycosyltransferase involved in cell wall biosynthesis